MAIEAALGRILAHDVMNHGPVPAAARSAMDGYAVRCADADAGRRLSAKAEIRIGQPAGAGLTPGCAIRVSTGGLLPEGCDAVVPAEHVAEHADGIVVEQAPTPGQHIVARGSDLEAGSTLLRAGRHLRCSDIGLLAAIGRDCVNVYRRPQIGVLSTGNEIVPPGREALPWQTYDSNRYVVGAALTAWGALPVQFPLVRDDPGELRRALQRALAACDGVVLSGGSSISDHDVTAAAVRSIPGAQVAVHGVKMKPGRPALLASAGTKPIIGLPGNPTAAFIALCVLARPLVRRLAGIESDAIDSPSYSVGNPIVGKRGWDCFVPVAVDREFVYPLPMCSSHVGTFAGAAGFVHVPPTSAQLEVGSRVSVTLTP